MSHILKNPLCPATQVMGKDQPTRGGEISVFIDVQLSVCKFLIYVLILFFGLLEDAICYTDLV